MCDSVVFPPNGTNLHYKESTAANIDRLIQSDSKTFCYDCQDLPLKFKAPTGIQNLICSLELSFTVVPEGFTIPVRPQELLIDAVILANSTTESEPFVEIKDRRGNVVMGLKIDHVRSTAELYNGHTGAEEKNVPIAVQAGDPFIIKISYSGITFTIDLLLQGEVCSNPDNVPGSAY